MYAYSPQPFLIDKIIVSGETYPSDKLYADEKTFLVNVLLDEVCDLDWLRPTQRSTLFLDRRANTSLWKSPTLL